MNLKINALIFGLMLITTSCGKIPTPMCILFGNGCRSDLDQNRAEGDLPPWFQSATNSSTRVTQVVRRLTPEQMSNQFDRTAGIECSYDQNINKTTCPTIDQYGLVLGGVDFDTARIRDPKTKINTLLYARKLADVRSNRMSALSTTVDSGDLYYDKEGVWSEADPFNIDDAPLSDGQLTETDGSKRWKSQLEKIYWLLLSRPPTDEELALMTAHFNAARSDPEPKSTQEPWREILYMIFLSEEYWHI